MCAIRALVLAAALAGASAATPALAAAPEAADKTLGMAVLTAIVQQDGTLYDGAGVVESSYDATNKRYSVRFNRKLAGCVGTASGWSTGDPTIANVGLNANGDNATVEIYGHDGTPFVTPFHLVVFCTR